MPGKRRRHVPTRTCIACQEKRPKRDLIRIVRTPEGVLELDPHGKRAGRGAYLCPTWACLEAALEQSKLERVLKCRVPAEDVAALSSSVARLLEKQAPIDSLSSVDDEQAGC